MGMESVWDEKKKALEMNSGDGCTVNVLNAMNYTLKNG